MKLRMARHSHEVLENKGAKRRFADVLNHVWGGADKGAGDRQPSGQAHGAEKALGPILAIVDLVKADSGVDHGQAQGQPLGQATGQSRGHLNGPKHQALNGALNGTVHGLAHVTSLERELGIEFHVVDGILMACDPGQPPLPTFDDHAKAFLTWLQDQEKFVGNEVPSRTLEELLYPHFVKLRGWAPYPWNTVAGCFRKQPGVRKRQLDTRHGPWRHETFSTLYHIPRPDEQVTAAAAKSAPASSRGTPKFRVA